MVSDAKVYTRRIFLIGRNSEHRFNLIKDRAGEVDREMIDA